MNRRQIFRRRSGDYPTRVFRRGSEVLRIKTFPVPWVWMLICGFSALVPLLMGLKNHSVGMSIFGSLAGYFIGLCDHRGPLWHRIAVATFAFLFCGLTFVGGILVHGSLPALIFGSVALVYAIALFGGRGGELERIFVVGGIEFFVASFAPALKPQLIHSLGIYFFVAYATALVGILASHFTRTQAVGNFVHLRNASRELISLSVEKHFYAIMYCAAILGGIFAVERYNIERGYWTLVTILLIMKPNRKESFERILQRLFGTLLGVGLGQWIISAQPSLSVLCGGVFLFAALVPYVWHKNYWLVTFCATNLVICLLSILQNGHVEASLTMVRL